MLSFASHHSLTAPRPSDWRCQLLAPHGLRACSVGTLPPAGDFVVSAPRSGGLDLIVGDVAGHGVSAAGDAGRYLASLDRIGWNRPGTGVRDPGELFEAWNREAMAGGTPERFATAMLVRFDLRGRMTVVDAGHGGLFLLRPGAAAERLALPLPDRGERCGVPLGVTADARYRSVDVDLSPGTVVVVATDGIWEARNEAGRLLGNSGVEGVLDRSSGLPFTSIPGEVVSAARAFAGGELRDDATCVAVEIEAVGATAAPGNDPDRSGRRTVRHGAYGIPRS